MKKVFLILIAFIVLGIVFFYSEERTDEGLSEVKYWIINPEEIRYFAPKDSSEFAKFISTNLIFQKKKETTMSKICLQSFRFYRQNLSQRQMLIY